MSLRITSLVRVRRHADLRNPVYVRVRPHLRAITELIADHLPAVQTKIRGRMLGELARRIVEREGELELYFELDDTARLAATILHVRHVIPQLDDEHTDLVRQFQRVVAAHDAARTEQDRRRVLTDHLRRHATNRRRLRADRAALRRHLDLDALKERHDGERHDLLVSIELGLDFIAGSLEALGVEGAPVLDETRNLLRSSDLAEFLIQRTERSTRWQTRRAAARATGGLVRTGGELPGNGVERLRERWSAAREHPWVQAAIVDVLWSADPDAAKVVTEQHLLQAGEHEDDFLRRRLLLDRVHRDQEWGLGILGALLDGDEPTEHVRLGIAAAARRLLPKYPGALDLMARLFAGPDDPGDASPRVRAHAARVLVEVAGAQLRAEDTRPLAERAIELLCALLEHEHDVLPLVIACEDLRRTLEALEPGEDHDPGEDEDVELFGTLVPALVELSISEAVSTEVHEEAAATLETLDRVCDPVRRTLVRRLRAALSRTNVPGSCRVGLTKAVPREQIGRALAELTREDWGVQASVSDRRVRLRRGDRFGTKLWRVLHELRNPAPNKRQGFRHTVGRVLGGTLRAHSGQLDENTATVVPGERVHIRGEGGWGRHVPSVDDASTVPLLRPRPVELYSSFGVTRLRATGTLARRLWSRLRLIAGYADVAAQRSTSLDATEPQERRRYLTTLRERYGIEVEVEASPPTAGHVRRLPERITSLLPADRGRSTAALALAPGIPDLARLDEWLAIHAHYFLSIHANAQASLAAFFVGAFGLFLGDSYRRRRRIDRARAQIPLCIGGWGTRGKSGTERIKAGLFHGLGYQVFSKTTGCEAMLIHSIPEGPSSEVFVFRPYGKATIWEQRNLLELGAALKADVFLWECMALNPKYVEVLQHDWMRDDLATLTNAYPDHEDVQGPAGIDVATVISRFIPRRGTVITSEINFLPLFREVCRRNRSELVALGRRDGDLLAPELLDLFPYQEHRRNIALTTRMAQQLGIDPELAIVTMARNVVPDLGVLKSYPPVRVRGRVLEFINGCSANERSGFLGNWERTGCAALAEATDPDQVVITVVNNREDRISRSEVFARILVGDTVVDRHVLIGTNLRGLQSYLHASMAVFLEGLQLVRPVDLEQADGKARATERLAALMRRLRVPPLQVEALVDRWRTYARGCGLRLHDSSAVERACEQALQRDGSLALAEVRQRLERDDELRVALEHGLEDHVEDDPRPEVLGPCAAVEARDHFVRQLARAVVHARLLHQLDVLFERGSAGAIDAYAARARDAYRSLFDDMLVVVDDAKTKGDAIIQVCARSVPPGTHVRIMGTQNIKGTGLDFVYRWLAVDQVTSELRTIAQADDDDDRIAALQRLLSFADHGVTDLGILAAFLQTHEARSPQERTAIERLQTKVEPAYQRRRSALETDASRSGHGATNKGWIESAVGWVEGWLDFVDGGRRYHQARSVMKDLVHRRISHPKAALAMREIYAREKGGWLFARLARRV